MGGQACKLKAILNGDTIQSEAKSLCYQIEKAELSDDAGYEIVKHLNEAEDAVFRAKRAFLESQLFTGPFPHALDFKTHDY